jgi:hypothetical protein
MRRKKKEQSSLVFAVTPRASWPSNRLTCRRVKRIENNIKGQQKICENNAKHASLMQILKRFSFLQLSPGSNLQICTRKKKKKDRVSRDFNKAF